MVQIGSASFVQHSERLKPRFEQALALSIVAPVGCPQGLDDAIRYSLLAPAKRLRPLLVLMAAESCGGSLEDALPAACAVEMIHTYSLIHDDLPAMDDDDMRRGRPTCHKVFGESTAILAGDALLTRAFGVLAEKIHPGALAAECCKALAEAAGSGALVGGQADDMTGALGENADEPSLSALESIHARKTGAMFLVSLRLGAMTARATPSQMLSLEDYGRAIGLAFQILDDLLDVHGDEAAVGKRVGKDVDRGKLTFPGLLGIEASRERAEALIAEACQAIEPFGPAADGLDALARYVLERDR